MREIQNLENISVYTMPHRKIFRILTFNYKFDAK